MSEISVEARIGILTISDRASQGVYDDKSGPAIKATLTDYLESNWKGDYRVIPDDLEKVKTTLVEMADQANCCLILTTGGTGPAVRDITPEATERVCHKILPGFGELMRAESLKYVPTAILSRQLAGIRNQTLIVNLPGKPKSIRECLDAVFPAIPYCVDLIGGPYLETKSKTIQAFRPKK